uniref:MCM9 N-terminal domain-containing protein n=1 Tax=Myotis myotis TaxID=51298 RepID=A0A7J7ZXK9_MYOMY|nr:hypothetical protein mMyoMyo1_009909 [Myotis myotis]
MTPPPAGAPGAPAPRESAPQVAPDTAYSPSPTFKVTSDRIALVGQDILLILKERDENAHYPVVVNAMTLFETNMEIGEYFNAFPNEVLTVLDNSLRRSAMTILESLFQPEGVSLKQNLHARISGDDVVDTCKSGDDLTMYGVVMQRWKPFQRDVRCEVEMVLKANYVQVNNEQSAGIIMDEEVRKEFGGLGEHY